MVRQHAGYGLSLCIIACMSIFSACVNAVENPQVLSDVVTLPMRPRPFHKLYINGSDDPVICSHAQRSDDGNSITYTPTKSKVQITAHIRQVDRLESAIGPVALMTQRGQQLLDAYAYPQLRRAAEYELVRFLTWGTANDTVMWGSNEIDAPFAEALEIVLVAVEQYPMNEKCADLSVRLLIMDNDDQRLEQMLRATIAHNIHWDNGFDALAYVLERQQRPQELYTFVQQWVKNHSGSIPANTWFMKLALANGAFKDARDAARRLWLRNKNAQAGAELAHIYLMNGNTAQALAVAEKVQALPDVSPERAADMRIIAGSALLAQGSVDEAAAIFETVTVNEDTLNTQNTPTDLRTIAQHNKGMIAWMGGAHDRARTQWEKLTHPASLLAQAIAKRQTLALATVAANPVLADTVRELNACLALEKGQGAQALALLETGRAERHIFLRRIAALFQSSFSGDSIQALKYFQSTESKLWRAYAYIQKGAYIEAESVMKTLPQDNGYAAVYRVYCAEGLKETQRAAALFTIAQTSKNPPLQYLSEMESHYLTLQSSRETENFKWSAGDVLRTGWFSASDNTGIHVFAHGDYLAFEGTQTQAGISRAWRKRSKERLRKIKAVLLPSRGWSGIELIDESAQQGIALAVEYIDENEQAHIVWRRLAEGVWDTVWHTLAVAPGVQTNKPITLTLLIDKGTAGNERIQYVADTGALTQLGSMADIPGKYLRVGFFTDSRSGIAVSMHAQQLIFEVRPRSP